VCVCVGGVCGGVCVVIYRVIALRLNCYVKSICVTTGKFFFNTLE
jgi:hypothetical protein